MIRFLHKLVFRHHSVFSSSFSFSRTQRHFNSVAFCSAPLFITSNPHSGSIARILRLQQSHSTPQGKSSQPTVLNMPFRLVQELEYHLRGMDACKEQMPRALELVRLAEEIQETARGTAMEAMDAAAVDKARGYVKTLNDTFAESAQTIFSYLCVPIITAMFAWFADALLGPLQWLHTVSLVSVVGGPDLLARKRPTQPKLVLMALSLTPRQISGSLTNLIGATYVVHSLCPAFLQYARQDISDREQVRYIFVGLLVDGLFLGTATLLGRLGQFAVGSVVLAVLVCFAEAGLLTLACIVTFDFGPWALFRRRRIIRIVGAAAVFLVQLKVFLLYHIIHLLICQVSRGAPEATPEELISDLEKPINRRKEAIRKFHTYQRLPDDKKFIRLLKIMKGRPHERVECRFVVVPLGGTAQQYEAVSYVWGDRSRGLDLIHVDDQPLIVYRSAADIIRWRRSMWEDVLIWIDQVCIDQKNNLDEKCAQVAIMDSIYREAALVTVWLGDSPNAYRVQMIFATLHFLTDGLGLPIVVVRGLYAVMAAVLGSNLVAEFFANEWFHRTWIIQEAALASNLRIIYGDICMDWEYLSRAVESLTHKEMIEAVSPQDLKLCLDFVFGIRNIDPILQLRNDVRTPRQRRDLANVLTMGHGFKSTDPRDKVYALLGLTHDGSRDRIKVDYDKAYEVTDVYIDAMLFILNNNQDPLRVLMRAGIGFKRFLGGLPSWVPDWSYYAHQQIIDNGYSADGESRCVFSLIPGRPGMISLHGVEVDQVRFVGEPNGKHGEKHTNHQALMWYFSTEKTVREHLGSSDRSHFVESFTRTLLGNRHSYRHDRQPSPDQCHEYYCVAKKFHETWTDGEDGILGRITLDRFLHFAAAATGQRAFCVTGSGRMAIVPPASQQDDLICLIKGARYAYVLRELSPKLFALVGCCYVDGIMEGEMAAKLSDAEPFVLV
jgi:hypothetical protein